MDEEKGYTSAGGAPEEPETGIQEQKDLPAEAVSGGAATEDSEFYIGDMDGIDLSNCSDEELEEIISGEITYEDYISRQQMITPAPEDYTPEAEPVPAEKAKVKKSKRKLVIPIVIAVVIGVAALILILLFGEGGEPATFNSDEYAVAYAKNSTLHVASYLSQGVLEGGEESSVKFSKDRKVAAFSKVHESNRYKDDLYFFDVRNREEIASGGIKIDSSVIEFYITPDGRHIIYTKAQEKQMDAYCYNVKERSAVRFDAGIHDFYIPRDRGDYFFYAKTNGASNTVYRYDIDSGKTENLLKGAGKINFISDENGSFLFAEVSSETEGLIDLYRAAQTGGAQKILSGILSVLYDEFSPGGKLYFMRSVEAGEESKPETYAFDNVITDDKAESDAAMTEPNKEDYAVKVLGFKTYDYISYGAAEREYKNKQERDKIREAIEKGVEKDMISKGKCSCCAYDLEKKTETVVCEGVPANGVVAVNKTGAPRVVFTKYRLIAKEQSEPITIDEALSASKKFKGSLEDYLKSLVSETAVPDGLALSVNAGGKIGEEEIKDYSAETASFFFTDNGSKLIALVKDEEGEKNSLVSLVLSDSGISVVNPIDNNVTQVIPAEKGYYYIKVDSGRENGDLFYYPDAGLNGALMLSVVEDVKVCGDGSLLVSHKPNGAIPSLSLCANGTVQEIDINVDPEKIAYYSKDCIAYVKNSEMGTGELYLYNGKTAPALIDSGVSKIFTDQP